MNVFLSNWWTKQKKIYSRRLTVRYFFYIKIANACNFHNTMAHSYSLVFSLWPAPSTSCHKQVELHRQAFFSNIYSHDDGLSADQIMSILASICMTEETYWDQDTGNLTAGNWIIFGRKLKLKWVQRITVDCCRLLNLEQGSGMLTRGELLASGIWDRDFRLCACACMHVCSIYACVYSMCVFGGLNVFTFLMLWMITQVRGTSRNVVK